MAQDWIRSGVKVFMIDVVLFKDDSVNRSLGPYTEFQARKVADRLEINRSKFYTAIRRATEKELIGCSAVRLSE